MPTIPVNLGQVTSAFEDLPIGSYLGEIAKIKLREPTQAGKFAQLMVSYLVIDGDHTGRRQTHWLSLSPNAMGFVKEFFAKFGLGEIPNLVIDDDTDELNDPDLYGAKVIFKNTQDKKDPDRIRTSLVSVEEWEGGETETVVKPKRTAAPQTEPAGPLANQEEAEVEETPAERKARIKAEKLAALQAELDAEDEDEEVEEAPAPKPARTAAPRPAAAATDGKPVRRTLR